jgi:predicted permease
MPYVPKWRRYLRFWRADVAGDIDDELRFHLEAREAELTARGLAPDAARAQALEEFGDVDVTRRRLREIDERVERRRGRLRWWHELRADLAYALRGLRRQPAFTAAVLLTLALGIGATAAMLTVARGAVVGALPFVEPDRLVHASETLPQDPAARASASYPEFIDWRDATGASGTRAFAALEAYDGGNVTLVGLDEPVRLQAMRVTAGFLAMLGVRPFLGRLLAPGDDAAGAPTVTVVSHDFWRRRLGGDPGAVGRTLAIDGHSVTVVGVLPPAFLFAGGADVWLPLDDVAGRAAPRTARALGVVGRLRDGVTVARASADLASVMRRVAERYPETTAGRGAVAVPLRDEIVGPTRPLLLTVGGAVALVLLLACANVASLLLARALSRGREMAVRAAIGAGRGRIARQLLAESALLALAGGALGALLAWGGVAWLAGAAPAHVVDRLPFLRTLTADAATLGLTASVVVATGLAFGAGPALHASRVSFAALVQREGSDGGLAGRARRALIVGEIALTAVLLVGAGLMARSVVALLRTHPGFAAERVVTMRLALAGPRYGAAGAQQRFFEDVLARVRALPGARETGAVSELPLNGSGTATFRVEGAPEPDPAARPAAMLRGVAGDYFRALGIPVVEGRPLGARDDGAAVPAVVVSDGLARRLFGRGAAVGRRVRFDAFPRQAWTVVGVVGDVRSASLDAPAPPTIYFSHLQAAENRMTVVVRTAGGPSPLLAAMRREAHAVDPLLPVYQAGTMAEYVASTPALYLRRYLLTVLGGFAGAALLLAAVGLYGVIAYAVARRTRELGVRVALGATRRSILALVLRQGAALTAAGIAAGFVAAAALGRVLATLLYGVRATDPLTYGAVAALLAAATAIATLAPARRATRVNPTEALRAD